MLNQSPPISRTRIYYRYFDETKAIDTLQKLSVRAANPKYFNDPFEVRPAFGQAQLTEVVRATYLELSKKQPIENIEEVIKYAGNFLLSQMVGMSEIANKKYLNHLANNYRILCFCRHDINRLMWAHYAKAHQGLVLGIDTSYESFNAGISREGFPISYSADRPYLPLEYYKRASMEAVDQSTDLKILTTKSKIWDYEDEVRFIYRIEPGQDDLFVNIPPECIKEVVLGPLVGERLLNELWRLIDQGKLNDTNFRVALFHDSEYKVESYPMTPGQMRSFYRYTFNVKINETLFKHFPEPD